MGSAVEHESTPFLASLDHVLPAGTNKGLTSTHVHQTVTLPSIQPSTRQDCFAADHNHVVIGTVEPDPMGSHCRKGLD